MLEEKYIQLGKFSAAFFVLSSIFILLIFWGKLPPQVPLFYSHPWGEEQLAKPIFLWILPTGAIFVFLGGLMISKFIEEKLLIYLVICSSALFSFFSFLTLFKIIILAI